MAVRLERRSGAKNLFRAGVGAFGCYVCAALTLLASPSDTRTLVAENAPADATPSSTTPSNPPNTPNTPVTPVTPVTPSSPIAPESPVESEMPQAAPEEAPPAAPAQVVEPAEESLHYPVSQWPMTAGQSPLFGTETIAAFSEEEMMRSKWSLRPHVGVATVYDGNIFISNQNAQSDFITDVSAGLTLRVGHPEAPIFLTADYTVSAEIFAQHCSQDSIDQGASLNLFLKFKKLTLGFLFAFQSGGIANIDIGNRVQETNFTGSLNASYPLGEEISLTGNVTESVSVFDGGFIGSESTQFEGYFNYQIRPKINIGIGGGFGVLGVENASSQTNEDISARLLYTATEKLSFSLNAGDQFRQFGDGEGSEMTPVFGIGFSWSPRFGRDIEVSAQRSIYSSASLQGQDYIATGVSFSISQRINDRFSANFATGYQNQVYIAAAQDVLATREDNFIYFRPGLNIQVVKQLNLTLYYEYSQDLSSGQDAVNFQRNRLGVQIGLLF